jgi:hypothetical protein
MKPRLYKMIESKDYDDLKKNEMSKSKKINIKIEKIHVAHDFHKNESHLIKICEHWINTY